MKALRIPGAALAVLLAAACSASAALENRLDSLGRLDRSDPYAEAPQFLIKSHGRPHLGLPSLPGNRIQKVSESSWYVGLVNGVARMEPDYQTGEVRVRELILVGDLWCVSPDGALMVARRKAERFSHVNECFDLASGESKWTFEKGLEVMSTCFSPDGKEVVALQKPPDPPQNRQAAAGQENPEGAAEDPPFQAAPASVSWYDAQSGTLLRRVEIPGGSGRDFGSFMAYAGKHLYLARPGCERGGECFVIAPGSDKPVKIEVEALADEESPRVVVGGRNGEFVAFQGDSNLALFRRDAKGALSELEVRELETSPEGFVYRRSVCFTPDGKFLTLSLCSDTVFIPTSRDGKARKLVQGGALTEFSGDGRFFITFDDGGGRIWDVASWKVIRSFESKLHPPHCCPITEAGYSMSGNYIVSCDNLRLLLWSKEGEQLAELYSSRTDANQGVMMQSPVILEDQGRIYAADGFDFLVWDLADIHKRLARKPDNIPRMTGNVVFRDRKKANSEPEVMNIRLDAKGENIITATQYDVRFRPVATAPPLEVPVPEDDIMMMPRAFMPGRDPSSIIVRPGFDAYTLDLTGGKASSELGTNVIGMDPTGSHVFSTDNRGDELRIISHPIGQRMKSTTVATLPAGCYLYAGRTMLSPDCKWIIAIPAVDGKGSMLAVIDVEKRQLIHSQSFRWTATSLSLSADGSRLLVGGSNRTVYEFDFRKITGMP